MEKQLVLGLEKDSFFLVVTNLTGEWCLLASDLMRAAGYVHTVTSVTWGNHSKLPSFATYKGSVINVINTTINRHLRHRKSSASQLKGIRLVKLEDMGKFLEMVGSLPKAADLFVEVPTIAEYLKADPVDDDGIKTLEGWKVFGGDVHNARTRGKEPEEAPHEPEPEPEPEPDIAEKKRWPNGYKKCFACGQKDRLEHGLCCDCRKFNSCFRCGNSQQKYTMKEDEANRYYCKQCWHLTYPPPVPEAAMPDPKPEPEPEPELFDIKELTGAIEALDKVSKLMLLDEKQKARFIQEQAKKRFKLDF